MAPEITKEAEGEPQDQAQGIGQRVDGDQQRWNRGRAVRTAVGTPRGRIGISFAGSTVQPWNLFRQGAHGPI
jgi:hypothetical protein